MDKIPGKAFAKSDVEIFLRAVHPQQLDLGNRVNPEKSQTSSRDAARGRLGQGGRRIAGGLYGCILSEPRFEFNAVPACLPQVAADGL